MLEIMSQEHPPTRTGPLSCPKCKSSMARARYGDIDVDRCQSCGGLWLDALEKEKLLRDPRQARAADAAATIPRQQVEPALLLCPHDHSHLIRMVDPAQPHVQFETCTVCGGTYLDAGELSDLSEFTLAERIRRLVPGLRPDDR